MRVCVCVCMGRRYVIPTNWYKSTYRSTYYVVCPFECDLIIKYVFLLYRTNQRMNNPPPTLRFEEIVAKQCVIQSIHCVQITNQTNDKPITICSYSRDATQSMVVACPEGGVTFNIQKGWVQNSNTINIKSSYERHDISNIFTVVSTDIDFTSATHTLVSDKLKLQSSVHPLDIYSFSSKKHGLSLKCPKGGIVLHSGIGGITQSTSGNIDYQLESDNAQIRLATRGTKRNTILLGNTHTETIVENQLTVRGKLVLSDDSVIEKHVSVVHELQNIVELSCQNGHSSSTFDYGLVAKQNDKKSGIIYDHTRDLFYFSTELGKYQQNRFTLPKKYADVQAKALIAQQKIQSPYVEAHCVQSRMIRCGRDNVLVLQSPIVQCSERLVCTSLQSDLNNSVRVSANHIDAEELTVHRKTTLSELDTRTLTVNRTFEAHSWFFNTVGAHGTHRTLQDYLDASDDVRNASTNGSPDTQPNTQHAVMEASDTAHNCNAIINRPKCVIDGRHSLLTGVMEVTEECEELLIVDARVSQFTLASSTEYKRAQSHSTRTITLRNVHGNVKDWCFEMKDATIRFEFCQLEFQNKILGCVKGIDIIHSVIGGGALDRLDILDKD